MLPVCFLRYRLWRTGSGFGVTAKAPGPRTAPGTGVWFPFSKGMIHGMLFVYPLLSYFFRSFVHGIICAKCFIRKANVFSSYFIEEVERKIKVMRGRHSIGFMLMFQL